MLASSVDEPPLLLDLSTDLEAFNFSDTEHLTARGKRYVAEQVAAAIAPSADPKMDEITPDEREPTPDATPTPVNKVDGSDGSEDNADATPMPPLLATQLARLTPTVEPSEGTNLEEASEEPVETDEEATPSGSSATATPATNGDDGEAENGGGSAVTPVQNPLLATTLARVTPGGAATPTPAP